MRTAITTLHLDRRRCITTCRVAKYGHRLLCHAAQYRHRRHGSGLPGSGNNNVGLSNTAVGLNVLYSNTNGNFNSAFGREALYNNASGGNNTAQGYQALYNATSTGNTAVGYKALLTLTSGANNTALGYLADVTSGTFTNATAIGHAAKAAASNVLILGSGASVGIGSNAPKAKLDVVGTMSGARLLVGTGGIAVNKTSLNGPLAAQFNGSAYLSASGTQMRVGAGSFTFAGWVYFDSVTNNSAVLVKKTANGSCFSDEYAYARQCSALRM